MSIAIIKISHVLWIENINGRIKMSFATLYSSQNLVGKSGMWNWYYWSGYTTYFCHVWWPIMKFKCKVKTLNQGNWCLRNNNWHYVPVVKGIKWTLRFLPGTVNTSRLIKRRTRWFFNIKYTYVDNWLVDNFPCRTLSFYMDDWKTNERID